jgi:hypothetical protein
MEDRDIGLFGKHIPDAPLSACLLWFLAKIRDSASKGIQVFIIEFSFFLKIFQICRI